MDRRAAGALLALAACFASSAAAPTVSNQTALDLYDAASEGCYYNFQHYGEGDRIMTNEPCLNCTCHNRMLMCYLRVCPFTKPIGQDCTVEKRADQCCPIVTCPDVPVDLLTSTSTSSPAEYGATGLGKLDKYGCSINGKYFPEGSKVPPTPNKPCEHCYCIRNMTTCVMQECTLHVDGCTPIYHKDVCCPVRYSCDHPEDEMPLLDDMSTTVRPTPGFLLTTTTLAPVTQMTQDCVHNDQIFPDGTSIKTEKACEHCYCMKGDIVCVVQECGTPMENEGKNCTSVAPREGQCCPDTYICEGDEVTTELILDYTTEPSIEKLTTLVPPRRVLDEGSGYRKEEEPTATEAPIEPEVEGSGEEFATTQPSDETEKETPSLIDERISSTEDMIGRVTTPQSDAEAEKATTEPDNELNTVPSGTIESSESPKLTTTADDIKSNEQTEQTHAESERTTTAFETKDDGIPAQTTEPAFRKEDESLIPIDTTTEKIPEYYTTSEFESSKVTKDESVFTTEHQPLDKEIESKLSTPALSEDSHTEVATEIAITTAHDVLTEEPSVTVHEYTESDIITTVVTEKSETTTLNAQENEIEDGSTTLGPGRIPGEGDCLQNGITYRNESAVPSTNNCQTECKCVSSIIKCDPIICSDPPQYMSNCVPTYDSSESCCPTYVCDDSKETLPPQPHSQMSETTSSPPTPAIECEGDQCEVQKIDKTPEPVPSDISQTDDCGSEDCKDISQTPVKIDIQPECPSEGCEGAIKPESHEQPSTISPITSESCTGGECQQQPIEKEDALQPCEGDNCKVPPPHVPEAELSCEDESCKIKPSACSGEGCKSSPESSSELSPTCEGENCQKSPTQLCENEEDCKTADVPEIKVPCEGESCKIEPTECNHEGCKVPSETIPIEPTCEGDDCKTSPIEPSKLEPCEGETCKLQPSDCNDEGCKTPPKTIPGSTCEGENCEISPVEPCQNEEECKTINVPKVELPCEGESCKLEPSSESTPTQASCEGDTCASKDEQEPECIGEECKKKISPDVAGELPAKCDGVDCVPQIHDLPEKTDLSGTESPLSIQDKDTEVPSVTTEYLPTESTKSPEFVTTIQTQTSEFAEAVSTQKSDEVTKLDGAQTELSTEVPERKTTEYKEIIETTSASGLESQTEDKHELDRSTTPAFEQHAADKETEVSETTEFDEAVTKIPETPDLSKPSEDIETPDVIPEEISKPEITTEKQEKETPTTALSDLKSEIGSTEPASLETSTQSEKETSPEFSVVPEISTHSSIDEQDTKLDDEKEATTESIVKSSEQGSLDDEVQEMTTKGSEDTSEAPKETPTIEEKITPSSEITTPSQIFEISTEETRSGTPATPESSHTSSSEGEEFPDQKTDIPDLATQEPIVHTTSIPEYTDKQEPGKQDVVTTAKYDFEPSTSQATVISELDTSDTEKPMVDKDKVFETEEILTEPPEIYTEEPSPITHEDDETPLEPDSPYIPVKTTAANKLESDITDKETTPEIGSESVSSTEQRPYSTTPAYIEAQTQESTTGSLAPGLEYDSRTTLEVDKKHDMQATEPSINISPTDTRKYIDVTTDRSETITTKDEITTHYPTEEKLTESPIYSDLTTLKSSQKEDQPTTVPIEVFSTEKQEVFSTEAPESHVKETEGEHKLSTTPETVATEKLKPTDSEEYQTQSPSVTESQPISEPVEIDKEQPIDELEKVTFKTPEQTSEPKFEYSETTPDMIELVEHTGMLDTSTLPSSVTDEKTTITPHTDSSAEKVTTEKLETTMIETEAEKATTTSVPLSEITEEKTQDEISSTPSGIMKDHEIISEHPEEVKPDSELATLKPDIEETKPESKPDEESTTEIVKLDENQFTEHPYATDIEKDTGKPESTDIDKLETPESDTDRLTTRLPEESVTDLDIKPDEELSTEEPGSGEMEVKPEKDYSSEKPEILEIPVSEQESTTVISEQPYIREQTVTDKTNDVTQAEVPTIENEIIPEEEQARPTVPSVLETEISSEKDIITIESEYAVTKPGDLEPLATESPMEPEIIQQPEIESSTEHKLLPEEGISTDGFDISVTEKEVQEQVTKQPELDATEIESSTKLSEPEVSVDDIESQPSTAQPELIASEQSASTEKESTTEHPATSETEQEITPPVGKDDVKADEEPLTASQEKEHTTEKPEVQYDVDKETSTKTTDLSEIEKESEYEPTTALPETEHKLFPEEATTVQPMLSIDQEPVSEIEPTERLPESGVVTEKQGPATEDTSQISTTAVSIATESEDKLEKESSTEKTGEQTTITFELEPESETKKPDISEEEIKPELSTKEPEILETLIPEHSTEPQRQYTTDKLDISSADHEATTESVLVDKEPSVTEHDIPTKQESGTKEPQVPEEVPTSEQPVNEYESTVKTTSVSYVESMDDKESSTSRTEFIDDSEKLSTSVEPASTPSSAQQEEYPGKLTEATPESHDDINKQDEEVAKHTTPGYTMGDATTTPVSETVKPSTSDESIPVHTQPDTEKPIEADITRDTTAPEEEFLTVTSKATTPRAETKIPTVSEDLDKTPKPQETQEETSSTPTPEVPKPGLNDVQATDEVPVPEEEGHFPPSATGGYGQEPDYEDENQPFGPGTCRYGGKVYVSAQQIPRDDPCDFCFCFRSDIICLQQSCPPPIHGCHEEPIQGFCCPRYECPVSMASTLNITTTTTTTTTTLPPHFLPHAYQGAVQRRGCQIKGHTYKVGEVVRASSGPCLHCTCGGDGQMKCDPKACTPEPMLRQMIAAAVSAKRRR